MASRFTSKIVQVTSSRLALTASASSKRMSTGTFRPSIPLKEKITINVPTMGDSITEGTIVEWLVTVGQAVKADDVIALVETDKVTIDIKADLDGVIVQCYGEIDETVEVGAKLYEIDTEGTVTVTSKSDDSDSSDSTTSTDAEEVAAAITSATDTYNQVRTPSIQFLGKDGWKQKLSVQGEVPTPTVPLKPNGSITLDGGNIAPMYGRLPFSEREMEALLMGGASEEL
mmetsp:Transcript_24884/g.30586  ORF Transcript_24884/g.30586 Transcript_24884/m.30586 type:complete len:229 (+) Transcript_24884:157-843(+)